MSNAYSKNKKELAGVKVVSSSEVWLYNKKTGEKDKLNPDLDFVGKVDMSMPSVILKANRRDKKTAYVEDVCALPKRTKNEIINHFFDSNGKRNKKKVGYLIRTDSKSKSKKRGKK